MPRQTLDYTYKEELREAYFNASEGLARRRIIERAIKATGYSYGGLLKALKLGVRTRTLSQQEVERVERFNEYGQIVWAFQQDQATADRRISTWVAVEHLKEACVLPEEVDYFQISEAIRRQKLKNRSGSHFKRFQRSEPLTMIQVDFTRSVYLSHTRKDETSYLKVSGAKPGKSKRERVWIAVAIDDSSRVTYARYYLTKGESSRLAQNFVLRAFKQKAVLNKETGELVPIRLLQGLPKQLYTDRGSAFRNATFANGLRKLGVKHILGANATDTTGAKLKDSNKQARGKVERMIRFIKDRFETQLFLGSRGKLFTLKEINRMLQEWLIVVNSSSHPENHSEIRWDMFAPVLETIQPLPEEPETLFANSVYRKVNRRQVRVADGIYCKSPLEVSHGDTIEIITIGDSYYTMIDDKRILLEVLSTQKQDEAKAAPAKQSEFETDYLEGMMLRSRLNKEIERRTRQGENIGTLSKKFATEIGEFIASRRSVKEIKSFAATLLSKSNTSDQFSVDPEGGLIENEIVKKVSGRK